MEDTKADIVEAPQEPMPSSDQQQQVSEPTEPSLPEGVSDRTAKEFEKLKALKDQSKLTWERFIFQRLTQ